MSYHLRNTRRFTLSLLILITLTIILFKQVHPKAAIIHPTAKNPNAIVLSNTKIINQDESYLLTELNSKQVLNAQNENVQRAPASTTKLLSGLVAIDSLDESEVVRVGNEVAVEGSHLGLKPGDEITVHDLFTAMYLISANDAAAAIAVKEKGSIPEFAVAMNQYAASLGCKNSHFVNPHGLPDIDHYTTANDLTLIAEAFINNPKLMEFTKKKTATVTWKDSSGITHQKDLTNTNELLNIYPGNVGLKTGTTTEAGQCLVSYNIGSDGKLLLVLLGSKHRYLDAVQLLDQGWAKFRPQAAIRNVTTDPTMLLETPGIWP